MLSIVSIDVGLKTLSIYKEYFDNDAAKHLQKPKQRYLEKTKWDNNFEYRNENALKIPFVL
jgi:hypothetical protein